jgi:hypothetical protein
MHLETLGYLLQMFAKVFTATNMGKKALPLDISLYSCLLGDCMD